MAYAHCIVDASNMAGTYLPSKHVNVKITEDLDNGNIVVLGALATGESEAFTMSKPTASTALAKLALIKAPEVMKDERLKNLGDFYNKAHTIVRAYLFEAGDEFRLTAEGLSGTPAVGSVVEADADYKMKVATTPTTGSTQIGTIIAIEGDYYVVRV